LVPAAAAASVGVPLPPLRALSLGPRGGLALRLLMLPLPSRSLLSPLSRSVPRSLCPEDDLSSRLDPSYRSRSLELERRSPSSLERDFEGDESGVSHFRLRSEEHTSELQSQ